MAHFFYSGLIATPGNAPEGFAVASFSAGTLSETNAPGVGEQVMRVLRIPPSTAAFVQLYLAAPLAAGDIVLKYRIVALDTSATGSSAVPLRLQVGGATIDTNGMQLTVYPGNTSRDGWLETNSSPVATTNLSAQAGEIGKVRYIRINWTASSYSVKVWNYDQVEPTAPTATASTGVNISNDPPSLIFRFAANSKAIIDYHWIAISDDQSVPAYKSSIPANDTTVNPNGNNTVTTPSLRTDADAAIPNTRVRLYHQETGIKLGTALTDAMGVATFTVLTKDVCYAIVTGATEDSSYNFLNLGTS